jgi:4-alpha-glucanotransferase
MSDASNPARLVPFGPQYRASGMLLHVTSLPSPYGIGDIGPVAFDYDQFCVEEAHWLDDYAFFRALKAVHGDVCYLEWPKELVRREPMALAQARRNLTELIEQVRFAQFLLFRQSERLREYARAKGIHLIGDLPFFVSPNSNDMRSTRNSSCWMNVTDHNLLRPSRTISARKGNCGETRSTIEFLPIKADEHRSFAR